MNTVEFTKENSRPTRWLLDAIDPYRDNLQGIHIENGTSVTTNGMQLRATKTPAPLADMTGKIIALEKSPRVNGDIVKLSEKANNFPNWRDVIPSGEPAFSIVLDGGLLASITKDMGYVRLDFYSGTQPIEIRSEEKYAILMPCHQNAVEDVFIP